jgi:5-formyltetrahydrofolate cyclo-ligase
VEKQALRERAWTELQRAKAGRFPFPLRGRIPNFVGAESAAERLATAREWREATRIKCNPDAPQRPVRRLALDQGKVVFMAVPRLRDERCFLRLDPAKLRGKLGPASSIKGAFALGEPVRPREMGRVDLVMAGSVAVNPRGERVGKGGGYSDLEFALARAMGVVGPGTPVATTVHDLQVVRARIPMTPHDVPLDLIATPTRLLRCPRRSKPTGLRWQELSEEQVAAMPLLRKLRRTANA